MIKENVKKRRVLLETKINNELFDVLIVGGGIYGIMLSLEASRRKIKTLLIEKKDYCWATSSNHHRIIHGGLRYLQYMGLKRFFESVLERRWFLKHMPQYTKVLPCIMPLYNDGIKHTMVMKIAGLLNDLLSSFRNKGLEENFHIPSTRIISKEEVIKIFPHVKKENLKGALLWYDAKTTQNQRLCMDIIRRAKNLGGYFLNYAEIVDLNIKKNKISSIKIFDKITNKSFEIGVKYVVNATGPWSREFLKNFFNKDSPELLPKKLVLWNILFDKEALTPEHSVAVAPNKGKGHIYFIHSHEGKIFAGTGEKPFQGPPDEIKLEHKDIKKFIDDINKAIPDLNIDFKDIIAIYKGILPATNNYKLTKKEVIASHKKNGIENLISVSGVKFTTSRRVAEKIVEKLNVEKKDCISYDEIFSYKYTNNIHFTLEENISKSKLQKLKEIIKEEDVFFLGDLIFRRTSIGDNLKNIANIIKQLKNIYEEYIDNWDNEENLLKKEIKERQW